MTDQASEFVKRFAEIKQSGVDMADVVRRGLMELLGETPAYAMEFYLGGDALTDPSEFVKKLDVVFAGTTQIVLEHFLVNSSRLVGASKEKLTYAAHIRKSELAPQPPAAAPNRWTSINVTASSSSAIPNEAR